MNNRTAAISQRLMSLDALRGFDMFLIIGGVRVFKALAKAMDSEFFKSTLLPQFEHAEWGKCLTFQDLIMPLFLFIVGVAMPFSLNKRLARGDSKKQIYFHIIKRVAILWILGMIAQGRLLEYDLSRLRIYCNTLQAIAAGYLIASIIMLQFKLKWQIITTGGLLLLFWALMALVPVPGHGCGVFTPDGNLANYLDMLILGRFDDGLEYTWILSSITFGCTTMLGVMAGYILRSEKSPSARLIWLFGAGIGCWMLGLAWGLFFPINKYLWTSSFTLLLCGICFLLMALFYLVIDVWKMRRWALGFVVIGMNPIVAYMAVHVGFDFRLIGNVFVGGLAKWLGDWNGFVQQVAAFVVIWQILYWMYRKKTFVKI